MPSNVILTVGNEIIPPERLIVNSGESLTSVMRFIDAQETGMVAIVNEENELIGIVSDGDIRRAIIKGIELSTPIKEIMNANPLYIKVIKPLNIKDAEMIRLIRTKILKQSFYTKLIERVLGVTYIPIIDENSKEILAGISVYISQSEGSPPSYSQSIGTVKNLSGAIKRVLVIGGAGYVGTELVDLLVNEGYSVRVLDNFLWGKDTRFKWEDNPQVEVIEGDVQHIETVVEAMKEVDAVCHLAALVGDPACDLDFSTTLATNYLSTIEIAEICKYFQINRFIFASTCSVYGASLGQTELKEASPLSPVSTYARTKIDAERALIQMTDRNFSPTILRKATIYGISARMRFDLVINLFTVMAYHRGEINIFGGDQWRPFIHVEDAAQGYLDILSTPISKVKGQIFNLGNNAENYKINQIGEIIKEFLPETKINYKVNEEDPRNYFVNFNKIQSQLNFKTRWNVKLGIQGMIEKLDQGYYSDWENPKYSNFKMFKEMMTPALY
jgi:nucleoside-diphosphate-sugar epimerase